MRREFDSRIPLFATAEDGQGRDTEVRPVMRRGAQSDDLTIPVTRSKRLLSLLISKRMFRENRETNTEQSQEKERELLRHVIDSEKISSDKEFFEAVKRRRQSKGDLATVWEEGRRIDMYLVSKAINRLYKDSPPKTLVELGSAGNISPALALPETQVTSVDIDPNIFLNCPYNKLPRKYFSELGKKKDLAYYGEKQTAKLALAERLLPNWKKVIADARNLPFSKDKFDVALVWGTGELLTKFIKEAARVVRPGGHIVSVVWDFRPDKAQSVYKTGRYYFYPKYKLITSKQAESVGLEKIRIPSDFEACERASQKDGQTEGFIFEMFKKEEAD